VPPRHAPRVPSPSACACACGGTRRASDAVDRRRRASVSRGDGAGRSNRAFLDYYKNEHVVFLRLRGRFYCDRHHTRRGQFIRSNFAYSDGRDGDGLFLRVSVFAMAVQRTDPLRRPNRRATGSRTRIGCTHIQRKRRDAGVRRTSGAYGKADLNRPLRSSRRRCSPASKMRPLALQPLRPCFGHARGLARPLRRPPSARPSGARIGAIDAQDPDARRAARIAPEAALSPRETTPRAPARGRNVVDLSRGRMVPV